MKQLIKISLAALWLLTMAFAAEHPIGQAKQKNGMEIGAVYLQPVIMVPTLAQFAAKPDVHLEADIHALKKNPNGFAYGEWIPYLTVTYHLVKLDKNKKPMLDKNGQLKWQSIGQFMPMVASDGPHYGANVSLDGVGNYQLTYRIYPPNFNGFYRHNDKATGVSPWWKPFTVSWTFTYLGAGKKGGY